MYGVISVSSLNGTVMGEQALLIFERKIFRRKYGAKYMVLNMKMGNGKVGRIAN
jgi:hypothetical protein